MKNIYINAYSNRDRESISRLVIGVSEVNGILPPHVLTETNDPVTWFSFPGSLTSTRLIHSHRF